MISNINFATSYKPSFLVWSLLVIFIWIPIILPVIFNFSVVSSQYWFFVLLPFSATVIFCFYLLKILRHSTVASIGILLVMFWITISIAAPILPILNPNENFTPYITPFTDSNFFLGTDHKGRDILSRTLWGCQRILVWGFCATAIAYVIGIISGLLAGYKGGWWDEVLSFIMNIMLSFPTMILFILVLFYLGTSGINIIIAVTIASSPAIMRIVRGLVLEIKSKEHVLAAQVRGESIYYILSVEILPNIHHPLIVDSCLRLGYTTVTITTLTFLGLGLQPPDPDWGLMIKESRNVALNLSFSYMLIIPAFAVSSLVLGLNLFADGWRESKNKAN